MIQSKKIGCFTDVHIGLNQDSPVWHKIVIDFAEWAAKTYKDANITDIVICGDIFHNRSEISVSTLSIAKKFFDYFKNFNIYILAGNHDSFYKDSSEVNSISILDGWNNIKIIDKEPFILKIANKTTVLVPWGVSFEEIPKADIIFGHFEIVSFYMNTYKMCEHGFNSNDLFQKGKTIISGHFHKKDHRTYKNGEIVYLGSPYQQNFGDSLDERGIYIYDVEENKFVFIENQVSPKYFKLSAKDIVKNNYDINFLNEKIKNNHVSLVMDSEIEDEKLLLVSSNIQKNAPVNFRLDYLDLDFKKIKDTQEKDLNFTSILEDIEIYVNSIDIKNKKQVIEYITDIFNKKTYE